MQRRPLCENGHCMIDRGARHKVYVIANTLQLFTSHRRLPVTTCGFPSSAYPQQAHLGARADRVAGRRGSRRRYRIDHGEALLRRRLAQDEPAQGPGGPCRAPPLCRLPPSFESEGRLTLERLLRSESDLDSGNRTMCAVATVKVWVRSELRCAVGASLRSDRRSRDATCRKKFLFHPLPTRGR